MTYDTGMTRGGLTCSEQKAEHLFYDSVVVVWAWKCPLTGRTSDKRASMKMFYIVCGKGFEEEIVALFREYGLRGYTRISGVGEVV